MSQNLKTKTRQGCAKSPDGFLALSVLWRDTMNGRYGHTLKPVAAELTERCEICGELVDSVYSLNEFKEIVIEGYIRWSFQDGCFGHKECLNSKRRKPSVRLIPQSNWERIPDDYKAVWSNEAYPDLVGRNTVLSGCISDESGSLMIEGINFEIIPA